MCLITFAYNHHPGYRLVLAANRDEFLDRPTATLGYHYPGETILAGRDLRSGGTWLGVAGDGRLAAITNYRDPSRVVNAVPSRGEIIIDYLRSGLSAEAFLEKLSTRASRYSGFNLLLADSEHLVHYCNISDRSIRLTSGVYGLSNHLLDTPWPKVERAKMLLTTTLAAPGSIDREAIFRLLADRSCPEEALLPDTGIGLEWERLLASIWIHSSMYGTRSSSVLTITDTGRVEFCERSYRHENGCQAADDRTFHLDFQVKE